MEAKFKAEGYKHNLILSENGREEVLKFEEMPSGNFATLNLKP